MRDAGVQVVVLCAQAHTVKDEAPTEDRGPTKETGKRRVVFSLSLFSLGQVEVT